MLLGLNFGFNDNPATVNANKYIIQIEILAQLLNGAWFYICPLCYSSLFDSLFHYMVVVRIDQEMGPLNYSKI